MKPQTRKRLESLGAPCGIRETTVGFLGLWEMGYHDFKLLGRLFRWNATIAKALARRIKTTDNPILRGWLERGLPHGTCCWLPFGDTVRCPTCGYEVQCVPCQACAAKRAITINGHGRKEVERRRLPHHAVKSIPGSETKIEVMRRRLERGEQLFHHRDAVLPKEWHPNESQQRNGSDEALSGT